VVSAGVLILRKTQPDRPRSFRVPLGPLFPLLSIGSCLILMMALPLETWLRFLVWSLIGMGIYLAFGKKNSALATQK
jgi:APA family basic amino acid/polyamine antiporter